MTEIRKKGVITFTAGRSGSSWLGSLVSSTGDMGVSGESLDMNILPKPRKSFDANSFFTHVLKSSSSDNGRFSMKVFPQHLRDTTEVFNVDLIRKFALEHNVAFALLVREDRVGQAISLLRARQTGIWGSRTTKNETAPPRYSFKRLCLAYFHL